MAIMKLKEVCTKIGSGATPRGGKEAYIEYGISLIRSQNVLDFAFTYDGLAYINEQQAERLRNVIVEKNDVLLNITGDSVARACIVPDEVLPARVNQHVAIIRANTNIVIGSYLLYYLQMVKPYLLQLASGGATRNALTKGMIEELEIEIPSLEEQKRIVSLIDDIQSKIRVNEEINNNIAEQIRTLCNAWLTDYEPFEGVCPDDWELTPLSSFTKFISGYSYKGAELQDSSTAMATIKNFDRKGGFKLDGYKEIVPSGKVKPEHHAKLYDTLVAHTDLTQNADVIGNAEPVLSFSGYQDIIFSMDVVKVLPDNPHVSKFLIAALLQTKQFKRHCLGYVNGTTVLHLSKKALPNYSLMMPKDFSVLKPLDDAVSVMYQKMASNIDENVQLTKLRDSILPRLMSGELDISELDI
ncbi:type I restriction enzyme, S subunit [Pseudobutyrivibrio sp. 49]|uniref:restriction endonuclease subunit S n=1 Tax=Pseudobutyrivibrio sp. 49 TaxID=1855344 RepID=UPI00087F1649|nr:restriction endonuclease subunit S [Pseudobutyrivibrio sp. 49]SDI57145.1 type I restriction enzyme, S subunit [Pseudobutyrivibrio sp. 49]